MPNLPNLSLRKSYTDMPLIGGQPEYPVIKLPQQTSRITTHIEPRAREWINALIDIEQDTNLPITRKASFSAFHAAICITSRPCKDISALLPLLNELINSPAMVAHCFKVFSKVVKELNPQQPPIITADQPVYAFAKQLQWLLLEEYKDTVVMLDPLHIEMAFLNAISDWLEGSCWVTIFERVRTTTVGHMTAYK